MAKLHFFTKSTNPNPEKMKKLFCRVPHACASRERDCAEKESRTAIHSHQRTGVRNGFLRHDSIGPQASAMAEAGRCWWSGQGMKERRVTN